MTTIRVRRATCALFSGLIFAAITFVGVANAQADSFPLYSFTGGAGGSQPGALVEGSDGNIYGTTSWGGATNNGTVFKLTPAGVLTTLYSFTGDGAADDGCPAGPLVEGGDGNFYGGTTGYGCGVGYGTIFKITPTGTLTTLHWFSGGDGAYPLGGLVRGIDGNFYGTNYSGGLDNGTVYMITPAGTFTTLHAFIGSDGGHPYAGLTLGSDGYFYGVTRYGGDSSFGTVFKMTPAGTVTSLYSFTGGSDASEPVSPVTEGSDGNFYGTTVGSCGTGCRGTVYSITRNGVFATIYSFAAIDGDYPQGLWPHNQQSGLVQASDGNFYGTTEYGGTGSPRQAGTVFKMTPSGTLTTLHSFDGIGGEELPLFGLMLSCDGNFYGTTPYGGANDAGTVFEMDGPAPGSSSCGPRPFARFVARADIIRSRLPNVRGGDLFDVEGLGVLGEGSQGILPATQDVTLSLGSWSLTVPAASFTKLTRNHDDVQDGDDDNGNRNHRHTIYTYNGKIGNVTVLAVIGVGPKGRFAFAFVGKGASLSLVTNPVTVGLVVGENLGRVVIRANIR